MSHKSEHAAGADVLGDLEKTVSERAEGDVAGIGGRAGAVQGVKLEEDDAEFEDAEGTVKTEVAEVASGARGVGGGGLLAGEEAWGGGGHLLQGVHGWRVGGFGPVAEQGGEVE